MMHHYFHKKSRTLHVRCVDMDSGGDNKHVQNAVVQEE